MDERKQKCEDISHVHLTEQEERIIEIIRSVSYGEVRVITRNGEPVHVEEIRRSIKL